MKEKYSPEEAEITEELSGQPIPAEKVDNSHEQFKSKIWKKRFAPHGSLFYGVKYKKGKTTYTNVILMNCNGKDEKGEIALWDHLWTELKKKYKL